MKQPRYQNLSWIVFFALSAPGLAVLAFFGARDVVRGPAGADIVTITLAALSGLGLTLLGISGAWLTDLGIRTQFLEESVRQPLWSGLRGWVSLRWDEIDEMTVGSESLLLRNRATGKRVRLFNLLYSADCYDFVRQRLPRNVPRRQPRWYQLD